MNKNILEAIKVLKGGRIVIFPTDTAFGIGCRMDNEKAIKRLFKIRKRPLNQPTSVLVDSFEMAQDYLLPIDKEAVNRLINKYWPGVLTLILYCIKEKVPALIRGGGNTLGVRMPDNEIALSLIKGVGVPILGPSANFHGEKTPYRSEDLNPKLVKLVDYVVTGECIGRKAWFASNTASTVIDCSKTPWRIIRQGAIKISNKKDIVLLIDTANSKEITVGLKIDGKKKKLVQKIGAKRAQVILPMIDKILKKHHLQLPGITQIEVNTGSGSFTGLRVSVAVVNALSFTLGVTVNDQKLGEL